MDLSVYDLIVVNSSGGKDSECALFETLRQLKEQGLNTEVVVSHQDLQESEWKGVWELVLEQSKHFGIERTFKSRRTNKSGEEETLLQYAERRGAWPDSTRRWCTSDFKRDPGNKLLTRLANELREKGIERPRILQVFGFRAEESPARAKRPVFSNEKRATSGKKLVDNWLPIHDWKETKVWEVIKIERIPYHEAYDLGMPRLSCVFCVFASKHALKIAGEANPDLLQKYVDVEARIEHSFRKDTSLAAVQEELKNENRI